ncbi:NADP-dependent oxidoreductase [Streptomyces vinaceus]|uniref:NADP-dependent oxidoreductase n=1 Tax=Streptomyces vinaceus TaxID=1960 RepID=UPI00380B929E
MRAMAYRQYGDGETLESTIMPMPTVGPGEILVRVVRAGVNPVDWKIMSGALDGLMDVVFPVVPGWDVAGVVVATGFDTPEFAVGDEVIAYARKDCVQGGTFAEYVCVPVRCAAAKPRLLNWEQSAGLPLAGLTAYQMLTRLGTGGEDTVLVHGAAGGVGFLACQMARYFGARVIGTASPRNHARLRAIGVEPVEYGDGLEERVKGLAPQGVSVVADFVGGVLDTTRAVLRDGGRHASSADPKVLDAGGAWLWVRPDSRDLEVLVEIADAGRLTVPVERLFDLKDLKAAFALSRTGHVHGKVIVSV